MLLPVLISIIVLLFILWIIFTFYKLAILALVNLVIGGMIILRMYHDLRIKNYFSSYVGAFFITAGIIIAGMSSFTPTISRFLNRFMILIEVQILAALFIVAQGIIFIKKSQN